MNKNKSKNKKYFVLYLVQNKKCEVNTIILFLDQYNFIKDTSFIQFSLHINYWFEFLLLLFTTSFNEPFQVEQNKTTVLI